MSDAVPESGSNQQLAQASSGARAPITAIFKGENTTDTYRNVIVARETIGIAKPLEASRGLAPTKKSRSRPRAHRYARLQAEAETVTKILGVVAQVRRPAWLPRRE